MAKQVQMWEAASGELFETELEANESDAKDGLTELGISERDIEAFEKLLDKPDLWSAFTKWMGLKHQVKKAEEARQIEDKKDRQAKCKHIWVAHENIKICRNCFIPEEELNANSIPRF